MNKLKIELYDFLTNHTRHRKTRHHTTNTIQDTMNCLSWAKRMLGFQQQKQRMSINRQLIHHEIVAYMNWWERWQYNSFFKY